jgi:hypothetical protein
LTCGLVGRKNIFIFFINIKIADKKDHSYAMFLTNVEVCWSMINNKALNEFMCNANENISLKNNFSSNGAIKFFGSRRFWRVGRKGETNKILF